MICQVCVGAIEHQKGVIRTETDDDGPCLMLVHHQSVGSLEGSALQGCQFCFALWEKFSEAEKLVVKEHGIAFASREKPAAVWKDFARGETFDDFDGCVTLMMIMSAKAVLGDLLDPAVEYTVYLGVVEDFLEDCSTFDEAPLQFRSDITSSEESWSKVSKWMNECMKNHTACDSGDKNWYPTRLLDLGGESGSEPDAIRVIIGAEDNPAGRYATLSHCWGSAHFIQLLKATLTIYRQGILTNQLPKTFRDAIQVTRRMGIRYLWIDSLCILQDRDDLSDWLVEASLMDKVYTNSYCNISASAASDSSQGLFCSRDPVISEYTPVKVWLAGLDEQQEFAEYDVVDFGFWQRNVSDCHINSRAWVLQERLLSPRVLHYGRRQLFWECREHDAAEMYPDGLPGMCRTTVYANFKSFDPEALHEKLKARRRAGEDKPRPVHYDKWHDIVQSYANTRLTQSGDKMIALSGIAKRFAGFTGDEYVAGMWRRYLEGELLWHVGDCQQMDGSPSVRPTEYRAPSFSWASVDGKTSMGTPSVAGVLFEVIGVHLEYATADPTGIITGGYADLKGVLRPFKMIVEFILTLRKLYMEVDGARVKDSKKKEWELGPLIHLDIGQNNFDAENDAGALFYMPAQDGTGPSTFSSFLLFQLVDPGQGTYKRIGLAVTRAEEEINFLRSPPLGDFAMPCRQCDDGLHVIRVI
ncbi:heterokaryon incompatibility protein [Xylariomycetidae sp. FL2044]|nr:heterokaryon incompatibility protein [Xylariomycetidae sp. FL2044]